MTGILLFAAFFFLLFLGLPVGFAIALASLAAILHADLPMAVFMQRMYFGLDSFPLMAVPLFMLAGTLMGYGGITRRIISLALAFLGNIQGSLAHVVAVSGMILGSISGSGVANIAALGSIMVPEMKKRGYDPGFSAALVATTGINGLILPPSIAIIIYGVATQTSIGDLFMAAVGPGLLIGALILGYSYYYTKKMGYPKEGKVAWSERLSRLRESIWALMMPILLIGGIYLGVFTPTEAGAIVSMYAFLIGMFIYKEIKIKDIPKICLEAALSTAVIAMIIAGTSLFGWLMSIEQIPRAISGFMLSLTDNRIILLLLINLLMLIIGMFLDSGPKIMLFAPIFAPVALSLGMDLLQFGVIVVINAAIGLLVPPVATGLFVASSVSGVPLATLAKRLVPFFGLMLIVLMMVTFIPAMTMWVVR